MIQRYRIGPIEWERGGSIVCEMNKDDHGPWVKWEDSRLQYSDKDEIDELEFWKSVALQLYRDLGEADAAAEEAWESIARPEDPQEEWDER